jgi:hypothetical protein
VATGSLWPTNGSCGHQISLSLYVAFRLSFFLFSFFLFQICGIQNLEFFSEKIKISEFKPEIYISPNFG